MSGSQETDVPRGNTYRLKAGEITPYATDRDEILINIDGFTRIIRDIVGSQMATKPTEQGESSSNFAMMNERMGQLESRFDRIETKIEGFDGRLRAVEVKLGEIGGQLTLIATKIPSWWQAPASAAGLVVLLLGCLGLASHFGILHGS